MNARMNKPNVIICYDQQLRKEIGKLHCPQREKIALMSRINQICTVQTQDCIDVCMEASFLALHDEFGFGQRRLWRLRDATQKAMDSAVAKYEIGAGVGLRNALKRRGIDYVLNNDPGDEEVQP